ncbi:MAG TPA: hypothetical protein VLV50_01885 [Stellaceae bacterium]|nr:hypothetical protein [Stellaceae bacterium]
MPPDLNPNAETAESLRARAERCRGLSRLAAAPYVHAMLEGLAQQLDGEACRAEDAARAGTLR